MDNLYSFQEFTANQRQVYADAAAAHAAYLDALRQVQPLRGGMHWKRIRGRDYLYRYHDRYGHGHCLGVRSAQTEELLAKYSRQRLAAGELLKSRRDGLAEQTRFCRAARLQRLPTVVTRILQRLPQLDPSGQNFVVLGSHAVHAYEFAGSAFLRLSGESDLFAGTAGKLTLAAARSVPAAELLTWLKKTDRSFQALPGEPFKASNDQGFVLQVLPPGVAAPWKLKMVQAGTGHLPPETGGLGYLLSSPRCFQVVIGRDGVPATLAAPDPRAFALHKLWLSHCEERPAPLRQRDRLAALAVADLVLQYLPQYYFFSSELRLFPEELRRQAEISAAGDDYSPDLNVEY
jgi:hypothetical protein